MANKKKRSITDYSGQYEIFKIVDMKGEGENLEYYVEWKDLWLPKSRIKNFKYHFGNFELQEFKQKNIHMNVEKTSMKTAPDDEIVKIVASEKTKGTTRYRIRWKNSWIPSKLMDCPDALNAFNVERAQSTSVAETAEKSTGSSSGQEAPPLEEVITSSFHVRSSTPITVNEYPADETQISENSIVLSTRNHQCFEGFSIISEMASSLHNSFVIYFVDHRISSHIDQWKVRCGKCASGYPINHANVTNIFAFLSNADESYFMIKFENSNNEVYMVIAETIRAKCSEIYKSFVSYTSFYFQYLTDLKADVEILETAINELLENPLVKTNTNNEGYVNFDAVMNDPSFIDLPEQLMILFYRKLQLSMGEQMAKAFNRQDLHVFALNFYKKRDKKFSEIIIENDVVKAADILFQELLNP